MLPPEPRSTASGQFCLSLFAAMAVAGASVSAQDAFQSPPGIISIAQLGGNAQTPPPAGKAPSVTRSEAGAWGRLEYFPVVMEAPMSLVEKFPIPNSRSRWAFPAGTLDQLPGFLAKAGLDKATVDTLMSKDNLLVDGDMLYVFPPVAVLDAMTSAQRSIIYAELRRQPVNEYHFEPVLITSGDVETWFQSSNLRPEVIAKIKHYSYMRGDTLAFSDLPAVLNYAQGEAEAREMVKAFTRTRALMVKLVLESKSDVPTIMEYWTTGLNLRRKDMQPLLESIVEMGAEKIDVVHMLPPLPRKLLMTYPDTGMAREGIYPDCHWTSLNFFNYDAQPYLLDSRLATTAVLERFNPVEGPYKFGDILFFLDNQRGDAFHSCVYIADDIVFTKNGRNVLSPWIFARLEDVKKVYLYDNNGRIQGYRNKVRAPLGSTEN